MRSLGRRYPGVVEAKFGTPQPMGSSVSDLILCREVIGFLGVGVPLQLILKAAA